MKVARSVGVAGLCVQVVDSAPRRQIYERRRSHIGEYVALPAISPGAATQPVAWLLWGEEPTGWPGS
jgi:hypothetical protein